MFGKAAYQEEETILHAGDTLLLFSDGVTEAVNPEGEDSVTSGSWTRCLRPRREEPEALLDILFRARRRSPVSRRRPMI